MNEKRFVFGKPIERGAHTFNVLTDIKPDGRIYIPYWGDAEAVIRAYRGGAERGYFATGAELLQITAEEYEILKEELEETVEKAKNAMTAFNFVMEGNVMNFEDALEIAGRNIGVIETDHRGIAHVVCPEEDEGEDDFSKMLKEFEGEGVWLTPDDEGVFVDLENGEGYKFDLPEKSLKCLVEEILHRTFYMKYGASRDALVDLAMRVYDKVCEEDEEENEDDLF